MSINPEYIQDEVTQSFRGSTTWDDVVFAVKVGDRRHLVRQSNNGWLLGIGHYSDNYWEPRKRATMFDVILYFAQTTFGDPETRNKYIEYLMSLEEPPVYNTGPLTISKDRIMTTVYTHDQLITAAFEVALETPNKAIYLSYIHDSNLRYVLEVVYKTNKEKVQNYHVDKIRRLFSDDPEIGPLLKTFYLLNGGEH